MAGGFSIAEWTVEPQLNSLERNGQTFRLEPKVMHVLVCLANHAGELVSKEQLIGIVWADTFVTDEVLTRCIHELRKALNDDPKQPRFIETIPKGGYRLLPPVEPLPAANPAGVAGRWRTLIVLSLGISAVLAAGLVIDGALQHRNRLFGLLDRGHSPPVTPAVRSIAVLPLESLSEDPSQEYFADGMTDGLITNLAKIGSLRVISRTSVMQYKHTRKPLPDIAQALHVDLVVTGTVLRSGDRVRITTQLMDGKSDYHLWAQEFERDLPNVLRLESDMAYDIAHEIRVEVTKVDGARLQASQMVSPQAHDVYLRGRYQWNQKATEALWESIKTYKQAIEIEPRYALAYAGLADSYIVLGDDGEMSPSDANPLIKDAATKAVEFDANLADAHMVLAASNELDWDWASAEREYRRAIDLNPGLSRAHHWYALLLVCSGRPAEAIAEIQRAVDLDPLGNRIHLVEATIYYFARQYDRVEQLVNSFPALDQRSTFAQQWLGRVRLVKRDYRAAVSQFLIASREDSENPGAWALLTYAYAQQGDKVQALKALARLRQVSEKKNLSSYWMAVAWTGVGDHDEAISWLNETYRIRSAHLMRLRVDPLFDPLRSDPRFQDLVRKIGLPTGPPTSPHD